MDLRTLFSGVELAYHRAHLDSTSTAGYAGLPVRRGSGRGAGPSFRAGCDHQLKLTNAPLAGHVAADGHVAVHEPAVDVEPLCQQRRQHLD